LDVEEFVLVNAAPRRIVPDAWREATEDFPAASG
jgi:hypothetical protein